MNMELMASFTDEQLTMCEKENLIEYIKGLKEEIESYKCFEEEEDINPLDKFIEQRCTSKESIYDPSLLHIASPPWRAPTHFQDIYYEYKIWCKEQGYGAKCWGKKQVYNHLLNWQRDSSYGLSLGKTLKDGTQNGTMRVTYFNLVVISED